MVSPILLRMIGFAGNGEPLPLRIDSFSTSVPDSATFSELFQRDSSVAASLIKAWKERRFRPVICEAGEVSPNCSGAFARELQRVGASQVVAHGMHDVHGQVGSFFTFACRSGTLGPRPAYLV